MKKNIVIIVDGTGCSAVNGRDRELSNAFRLANAIETDIKLGDRTVQVIHYFSGPASRALPFRIVGSMTGQETQEIVSEAYLSLVNTFDSNENCDIYLFGFSRGAIAVKVLAEIVCNVGILQKESCSLLRSVWRKYHHADHSDRLFLVDHLKTSQVRFVGVFDPVHGPTTPMLDVVPGTRIPDGVKYAVEICALDETRIAFDPSFWADTEIPELTISLASEFIQERSPRLQHIWIPGGHSDIGSAVSRSVLADLAFLTMVERLANCTPLPLKISTLETVFDRIIARSDAFRINSRHFPLFGSRRRVSRMQNSEMHPVFDIVDQRKVYMPKKARIYKTRARFDGEHADLLRYDMNLGSLNGSSAAIMSALTRNLGEM